MGAFLDKPVTDKEKYCDEAWQNDMRACVAAMQGWRVGMEDAHIVLTSIPGNETCGLYGVYDGHGGQYIAQFAYFVIIYKNRSENLLRILESQEEYKKDKFDPELIKMAFKRTYFDLDQEMRIQDPICTGEDHSGSTAVTAYVTPNHIICTNAGDSRCILVTQNGVVEMSHDHKPYNDDERNRILDAGGVVVMKRVNGDLAVARALGDFGFKLRTDLPPDKQQVTCAPDVTIQPRNLEEDQFLILACDGIWDVMTNEEIAEFISTELQYEEDINEVASNVIDYCLEKGSRDNMSVILVVFPKAPKPKPEYVAIRMKQKNQKMKAVDSAIYAQNKLQDEKQQAEAQKIAEEQADDSSDEEN